MTTPDDTTPNDRPTSPEVSPSGPPPGPGPAPAGAPEPAPSTPAPAPQIAAAPSTEGPGDVVDWLGLLARVTALDARIAKLEGAGSKVDGQIEQVHDLLRQHHNALTEQSGALTELQDLVGQIGDAVMPAAAQPQLRPSGVRVLPPAAKVEIGKTTDVEGGRNTALTVDPTAPGQQVVTLPGGQEVEINVKHQQGGIVRDGRRQSGGGVRRG